MSLLRNRFGNLLFGALALAPTAALAQTRVRVMGYHANGVALVHRVCGIERQGPNFQCIPFAHRDTTAHTLTALPSFQNATPAGGVKLAIPDAGSVARPLADVGIGRFPLRNFCLGTTFDGLTDDTACIQNAINAICARSPVSGGVLDFGTGTIAVNAAVGVQIPSTCDVRLHGRGWGDPGAASTGTNIKVVGTGSAPIFHYLGGGTQFRFGGTVDGLAFHANSSDAELAHADQTGPMVQFDQCNGCVVHDVYARGVYRFGVVYAGYNVTFRDFSVDAAAKGGEILKAYGSDATCVSGGVEVGCVTRLDIFNVWNASLYSWGGNSSTTALNAAVCIHIADYAASTSLINVACNAPHVGLLVDCPTSQQLGACPSFIFGFGFATEPDATQGDASGDAFGIWASDFEGIECDLCYVGGKANIRNAAKFFQNRFPAHEVKLHGGNYGGALENAVFAAVEAFSAVDTTVYDANQGGFASATSQYYAMLLQPGAVGGGGNNTVIGSHFCYYNGGSARPIGGLQLLPGIDYNVVQGSSFRGCGNTLSDKSGGTHNSFMGNPGQ